MVAKKKGLHHSLHVKHGTVGTSNEISFSVLDAKKQQQDTNNAAPKHASSGLGKIGLFSLPGTKKVKGAPKRDEGLPLQTGEFVSASTEYDPTGTTTLGTNAISGGTRQSGFAEGVSGSASRGNKRSGRGARGSEAAPSRELSAEEKAARQRTNRRAGITAVVLALITVVAYGAYNAARGYYEDYLTNQSYQQILATSLSSVVEADEILVEMDSSFTNMLGEESLGIMTQVESRLPEATQHLDKAQSLALRAQSVMSDQNDLKMAQNALDTIEARRAMLSLGEGIIKKALKTSKEAAQLQEFWNTLVSADGLARGAIASLSSLDSAKVAQTMEQAQSAIQALQSAREQMNALTNSNSELDLSLYSDYIALRAEALEHLNSSCQAIIDEDVPTASSEIALYNDFDMKAAQRAAAFVADITTLATDPFFTEAEQFKEKYSQAVRKAASMDTALREYLRSTSSK